MGQIAENIKLLSALAAKKQKRRKWPIVAMLLAASGGGASIGINASCSNKPSPNKEVQIDWNANPPTTMFESAKWYRSHGLNDDGSVKFQDASTTKPSGPGYILIPRTTTKPSTRPGVLPDPLVPSVNVRAGKGGHVDVFIREVWIRVE